MKGITLIVCIAAFIGIDDISAQTTRTTTTRTLQQRRTDLRRADTMGQSRRYNNTQRRRQPTPVYQPNSTYTPNTGTLPGSTNHINSNLNRSNSIDSVGSYRNRR